MYSENSKIVICLDSFFNKLKYMGIFRLKSVFETTALLSLPIYSIFLWLLLPDFIVIDEPFIAETYVWPIFCLSYEYFLCS